MHIRAILFSVLFLAGFLIPLPVFIVLTLAYCAAFEGYELLVIGVVIDSIFGPTVTSFTYTLSIGVVLIIFAFLRPFLSWYNTRL